MSGLLRLAHVERSITDEGLYETKSRQHLLGQEAYTSSLERIEDDDLSLKTKIVEILEKDPSPGNNLRILRFKHKMKQSELAEKIGVHASMISSFENGKQPISEAHAEKFASFFGTSSRTFFNP